MKEGERDIRVDLISICTTSDLALLKVVEADMSVEGVAVPLEFADDEMLAQTDKVLAIGYPLGQEETKLTTGGCPAGTRRTPICTVTATCTFKSRRPSTRATAGDRSSTGTARWRASTRLAYVCAERRVRHPVPNRTDGAEAMMQPDTSITQIRCPSIGIRFCNVNDATFLALKLESLR